MSEPKTEKSCSVRKEAFPEQDFIQNFSPRAAHRDFRRNSVFPQRALRKGAKLYRQRHGDHSQSHSLNLFRKGYCAMRSESNNRQKNRGPPQDLLFIVPIHSDI